MRHSLNGSNLDKKLFGVLLTPSWLSGVIVVTAGLVTAAGTILSAHYQDSSLRLDYLTYQAGQSAGNYQAVSSGLQANQYIADLPLFILWGLVGIVAYFFTMNLIAAARGAVGLKQELGYAHVNRFQLIWTAAQHLLVRLVVLALWVPYILVFFHRLVPYCVASALAGSAQLATPLGVAYVALAAVVMTVALHLHTVLLRLLFLRPRLFSQALYVD
jgi:hypothetical protein